MDALKWFVPPMDHDPVVQYAFRVRMAFFACVGFTCAVYFFAGMLLGWGPAAIRPASAQEVASEILDTRNYVSSSINQVRDQVKLIADTEGQQALEYKADRLDRIEQQLLWYRAQNCKARGATRNYTWQKMTELRDRYRAIVGSEWQMPACSDIGE